MVEHFDGPCDLLIPFCIFLGSAQGIALMAFRSLNVILPNMQMSLRELSHAEALRAEVASLRSEVVTPGSLDACTTVSKKKESFLSLRNLHLVLLSLSNYCRCCNGSLYVFCI